MKWNYYALHNFINDYSQHALKRLENENNELQLICIYLFYPKDFFKSEKKNESIIDRKNTCT